MMLTSHTKITLNQVLRIAADIERMPLFDQLADLIIANSSFNLTTNKPRAFAEAYRLLKPNGRLVMSDLIHEGDLPREIIEDPLAYTSSLGGVISKIELEDMLAAAGFKDIRILNFKAFSYVTAVSIEARRLF